MLLAHAATLLHLCWVVAVSEIWFWKPAASPYLPRSGAPPRLKNREGICVARFYFVHKKGAVMRLLMSSFMANYEKKRSADEAFY
jgi:hypothetical protein